MQLSCCPHHSHHGPTYHPTSPLTPPLAIHPSLSILSFTCDTREEQRREREEKREEEEKGRRREGEEKRRRRSHGHQLLEVITGELLLPHAVNLVTNEGGSPKLYLLQAQAMEVPQGRSTPSCSPGTSCCSWRPSLTWRAHPQSPTSSSPSPLAIPIDSCPIHGHHHHG